MKKTLVSRGLLFLQRQAGAKTRSLHWEIEERRRAEETLQRKNDILSSLLKTLPIGVFMVEAPGGRPLLANEAALELLGRGILPDADSQNLSEVYEARKQGSHGPYPSEEMPILLGMRGITSHIDDMLVERPDGSTTLLEVFGAPVMDEAGRIWASLVSFLDISERKRAEGELARLNLQLKSKNAELEQLVYVASHDLRSPLVNIDGYSRELEYSIKDLAEALEKGGASVALVSAAKWPLEEMAESLRYIRKSATQMDALLTGLLKLSRIGRAALTIVELDMNDLLAKVLATIEYRKCEDGVDLSVENLPPCLGDAVQVSQVFANLLGNALKYLDPARPGIIRVHGRIEGNRSEYCVEDNGIGIAPAHQENIFEVFHRLDPTKGQGEGLGLTIVRQALGRLGGEVRVESETGVGSRFIAMLPAAPETLPGDPSDESPMEA